MSAQALQGWTMVFGLFEDRKMTLEINKKEFRPGETVGGTLRLELKKPVHAERLSVLLVFHVPNEDFTIPIEKIHAEIVLGANKEYSSSGYEFSLKIPEKAPEIAFPKTADQAAVDNWKRDSALGLNSFSVKGSLDIAGQKPLTRSTDIKISYYGK